MKTNLVLILSAILVSASAFADVQTEQFTVKGPKAVAIERTLGAAGALATHMLDTSNLSVRNLDCNSGFAEHSGGGHFSRCTFQQFRAPVCLPGRACPRNIQVAELEANGAKAKAIINALEDAGVKSEQGRETARHFVVGITCNNMMGQLGRLSACRLEVPGGL